MFTKSQSQTPFQIWKITQNSYCMQGVLLKIICLEGGLPKSIKKVNFCFHLDRISSVCHTHVLVCHSYVTRISLHVIRMSLVCTCMSSVCHSYALLCHSCVTRMWFYHERVHNKTTYQSHADDIQLHTSDIRVHRSDIRMTYEYIRVTYG